MSTVAALNFFWHFQATKNDPVSHGAVLAPLPASPLWTYTITPGFRSRILAQVVTDGHVRVYKHMPSVQTTRSFCFRRLTLLHLLCLSCSASNFAASGVQVEAIWIPCGRDHCGCLWHSHTSHFQTIYNIFLPSVTLMLQSLCHLDTPLQFAVNNTNTDTQDQMEGRINIVIKSVLSACSIIHYVVAENVHHICLAMDAMQFVF